jgi:hypothetical protein
MSACKHCKRCKDGCDFCSCCGKCQRCDAERPVVPNYPTVNPPAWIPVPYPVYPYEVRPWWEGPTCGGATIVTNPFDVTVSDGTNANLLQSLAGTMFAAHLGASS